MTVSAMTVDEVARRLSVSTRTIKREIERERLKAVHVGRCVRVTEQALSDYIGRAAR